MEILRCAVCGMRISSKNYDINQHSFIGRNSENDIVSCPFCGVRKLYLSIEDEFYKTGVGELDALALKVLDNAMKLEVFNGEFYQEAANMARSEEVRRMFEDLSSIEFMHARVHMRLAGLAKLPALHKPDYSKHESDAELLAEAAKREKHAVHFYERNSGKVNSDVVRKVFAALSEVEVQHIEILEK